MWANCDRAYRNYNSDVSPSMNFATSSPAATTGGNGQSPVSTPVRTGVAKYPTRVFRVSRTSSILIEHQTFHSHPIAMAASLTDPDNAYVQPVCQNCTTSTTPLWRRDELGSVLCNACGLFLKLHGKPRPISLKTDVIKSRNRVKTAGQGPRKKVWDTHESSEVLTMLTGLSQSLFETNGHGLPPSRSEDGTPPLGVSHAHRRASQKASSGASDRSNSPLSRVDNPSMNHNTQTSPRNTCSKPPRSATLSSITHHRFLPCISANLRQGRPRL